MRTTSIRIICGALWILLALGATGWAQAPERQDVILATTTSTQDSGLLDVLVPLFEKQTGYRIKTIAVGTGEALAMGRRGDADVVLAHAPELEKQSIEGGFTIHRRLVMHNDFLIVGPDTDPAGIHGTRDAAAALTKIAQTEATFVSRGDNSGTHFLEKKLWAKSGIEPSGSWYLESGQGMGATLMVASEKEAYTLTDRGTFLAFKGKIGLRAAVEGDPVLLNLYSVMEVNPERFERANHAGAKAFSDFLLSEKAQKIMEKFGVDKYGEPLFFPDGGKKDSDLTG